MPIFVANIILCFALALSFLLYVAILIYRTNKYVNLFVLHFN